MHELDSDEKELLDLLLAETPKDDSGVDALAFRANNFEVLDLIDRLEAEGYIRRDQERYFVSLTALVQIANPRATRILDDAELLFGVLKDHYKTKQRDSINVNLLAGQADIGHAAAREALSYMVEGTWWGGRSTSFAANDAFIQPSETILRFNSFSDVIYQLRSWQAARIRDRQLTLVSAVQLQTNMLNGLDQSKSSIQRQRPDWFKQIPDSPREVLDEVYLALTLDLRALPAMGVRAVIDAVCTELIGDKGTFENRINRLKEAGHITELTRSILSDAIDAGSASAHRGYIPTREDLTTLLDVVEHFLQAQYVFPQASKKMKANTPVRTNKKDDAR